MARAACTIEEEQVDVILRSQERAHLPRWDGRTPFQGPGYNDLRPNHRGTVAR